MKGAKKKSSILLYRKYREKTLENRRYTWNDDTDKQGSKFLASGWTNERFLRINQNHREMEISWIHNNWTRSIGRETETMGAERQEEQDLEKN